MEKGLTIVRVSVSKILLCISIVLLSVPLALCNTVYIDYTIKRRIEVLAIIMSIMYLMRFINKSAVIKKTTLLFGIALLTFAVCVIYFTNINAGLIIQEDSTVTAILDSGVICSYFLLINKSISTNHFMLIKKTIVVSLGSFVLINDVMLYLFPELAKIFGGEWWTSFFLGSKFDVGYLHLFFIAALFSTFFQKKSYSKNTLLVVLLILTAYTTIFVDCNTGIIAVGLFLLFILCTHKIYEIFIKPQVFCGILLSSLLFVVAYGVLLNSKIAEFLIQDIFHRDLSLTGRTTIYKLLQTVMTNNIWTGYGYGIDYNVSQALFNYDNTQNGLMEWILQIGIIGTLMLVILLYIIFFRIAKAKPSNKIVPMLAFIYVLTIIAMVEISLDLFYFMAIGLLYGMSLDEEKRIKQKNYKDQSLNRKRLISATAAS